MRTVPAAELARKMTAALLRRGVSEEHAGYVVDGLIEASLRGVDTHGVRLFRTYLAELDGGRSQARPEMRWLPGAQAARVLDAGHALGMVAGRVAAAEAVRLARDYGVGAVSVRNSNHFGPASCYTLEMARQGAIGFSFTNSDALVAPFHGMAPLFGTNPISMAMQGAGDDLFCADLATSQVSYSRVKQYRERGEPLAPGWAVTAGGRDVAEAGAEAGEDVAALQPLGGHKGQCLGMAVEILCALLAGMPFDHELTHLYIEPFDEPRQVAHLFLALDLGAFGDRTAFQTRLSTFLALVRAQPAVAGERVVAPGDLESESAAARRAAGIPLTDSESAWFDSLSEGMGRTGC